MSGSGAPLEADFVVVGAGSAGCVMAARLSEDPATNVILLEAGGDDTNFWIHIPLGYGKTFADKRVNWMFQTEPDPGRQYPFDAMATRQSIGVDRRRSTAWSTRIPPGQSTRTSTTGARLGNPGWSASDVLPYYKRAVARRPAAR